MQIELMARPAASVAMLTLDQGEEITCETGAMIAMSTGMTVETTSRSRGGKPRRVLLRPPADEPGIEDTHRREGRI